jgi:hypothetical protein
MAAPVMVVAEIVVAFTSPLKVAEIVVAEIVAPFKAEA